MNPKKAGRLPDGRGGVRNPAQSPAVQHCVGIRRRTVDMCSKQTKRTNGSGHGLPCRKSSRPDFLLGHWSLHHAESILVGTNRTWRIWLRRKQGQGSVLALLLRSPPCRTALAHACRTGSGKSRVSPNVALVTSAFMPWCCPSSGSPRVAMRWNASSSWRRSRNSIIRCHSPRQDGDHLPGQVAPDDRVARQLEDAFQRMANRGDPEEGQRHSMNALVDQRDIWADTRFSRSGQASVGKSRSERVGCEETRPGQSPDLASFAAISARLYFVPTSY